LHQAPLSLPDLSEGECEMSNRRGTKLFGRRCDYWPDCKCAQSIHPLYSTLARVIDERLPAPTPSEVQAVEVKVFLVLSCLAEHCPVEQIRRQATVQLMNPYYERQRAVGR